MHNCPPPKTELMERFNDYPDVIGNFGHILLFQKESDIDGSLVEILIPYFESAHLDARSEFHHELDLHPDSDDEECSIQYPHCLPINAQSALFGEVMAGLVTEVYGDKFVGANSWSVPIFLFRFHCHAFQYMFELSQSPEQKEQIPGRSGTDFIGLNFNEDGSVIGFIAGEAKWRETLTQSVADIIMYGDKIDDPAGGIKKVHNGKGVWAKLNNDKPIPYGIYQLAKLLKKKDSENYDTVIFALQEAYLHKNPKNLSRTDLIVLVGNKNPTRKEMDCFLPYKKRPEDYINCYDLQIVEVVMNNGGDLIKSIYNNLWNNGGDDA